MADPPGAWDFGRFYDLPFIGMAVTSPSSKRWLHVNQTLCDILGYPREELVEKTWSELTHPDDLRADVAEFERVLRGETDGYKLDKRFIRKDGAIIYASIDVKCERKADGSIDRFFATVADVTQRTKTEAALRESFDLLANLATQVPGVIYRFQLFPDGRSCFPFASEAMWDIYEVTPEEVREDASLVYRRVHPDDLDAVARSIERSAVTLEPWRLEYRVVLPHQGVRWRSGLARPERLADGSTLWHGFISDVTAQQEAREALADSEKRYRVLIESAPEAIVVYDADTARFVDANANALRFFGLSQEELLSSTPLAMSPPVQPNGLRSAELAAQYIQRALAGELAVFEWTHRTSAGRDVPTEVRLVRLPSTSRRLVRGSITDITERELAKQELERLTAAIATSMSAIVIADASGTIRYVNPAFVQLWGYDSAAEIIGTDGSRFARGERGKEILAALLSTGVWQGELEARRKDGSTFEIMLSANVVRDAAGRVVNTMGSIADITDSKRLQAQLFQSQKMESVGRLAGGVAHDFNNLLTVMKGYLEFSRQQLASGGQLADDLAAIDRAVDSAASLTQQLLTFSRKQIINPRVLDLNESVDRMRGMLSRLLGGDIELRLVTAPDLWLVRFDLNQSEQMLVNLAVNARDAMPGGGRLTVETANVVLDSEYVKTHPDAEPGEYVMLAVSDTGTGMSAEVQSHLFEPFFTTKAVGRGTGLGLPMVYGAVTQNGGRIAVYSEPNQGTTFRIYLPRAREVEAPTPASVASTLPRGTETIAVVEDDDAIRTLAVRILSGLGYRTLAFASGTLALRAIEAMTEAVDLVLTDVIMPEMKGSELANRLRALRPGVRILFASGYSEDVIAHHGVVEPDVDFLQKPFSMAVLAQRVRQALDRPNAE